jgi:ABC-type molybdate transport system substrate-binding protein
VKTIDAPDSPNVPATYDGVVVRTSKNPTGAKALLDRFAGPAGQAIPGGPGFQPSA